MRVNYLGSSQVAAVDGGCFKDEIVPVELKDYKGRPYTFDTDEFPRRDTSIEKLSKLSPTFLKDGTGTVTAGNTSGINDGAAFMLLASEDYCKKHDITPLAEIIDTAIVGCDPQYMGLGPYYAVTEYSGLRVPPIRDRIPANRAMIPLCFQ